MNTFLQTSVEMADAFREDGKIWVVVGVIALVFLVLAGYLLWMERRLSALEKSKK